MRYLLGVICAVVIIGSWPATAQSGLPPANPQQVSGNITTAGTSALIQLTQQFAVNFGLAGFTGTVDVQPSDTASAIRQLCNGNIDVALVDRQITQDEVNACAAGRVTPVIFHIATDGVIVIVSQENGFVTDLTIDQLQAAFSAAFNWQAVNSEWVDQPIARLGPGTATSEFTFFGNAIFGGNTRPLTTALGARYGGTGDEIAANVANNPLAIGFITSDALTRNAGRVRAVSINGNTPTQATLVDNTYELSRPLFFYSTSTAMQNKPQVASFINFAIRNSAAAAGQVGLFGASAAGLQEAADNWLVAVGAQPTQQIAQAEATATTLTPQPALPTAQATPAVPTGTPAPTEPASAFAADVVTLAANARTDLEELAERILGPQRPQGWSGSLDVSNPDLLILLRLDLEILAATIYGLDSRPDEWFGAVSSTQLSIARDIRHDIELIANEIFGDNFVRPVEWVGSDPVLRCGRATQALADLLTNTTAFTITSVSMTSPTFCEDLEVAAARFAEVNLVDLGGITVFQSGADGSRQAPIVLGPNSITIDSQFAVGFTDRFANGSFGVVPIDTPVTPLSRSYAQFSNMLLIQGDGFTFFVDYLDTTLSREAFESLPQVEDNAATFCDTSWCR